MLECLKLLITINYYLQRMFYRIILKSLYYCNIRFPYRIRKVVRNITLNILGHEGENYEIYGLVKAIRGV